MQARIVTAGLVGLAIGAVSFTAWSTLHAQAAQAPASRVACLDVVKVFNEYERQRDLTLEMQQLQEQMSAENERRQGVIEAQQVAASQLSPDDPALATKRTELMKMQFEYRNWMDYKQAELAREVALWTARTYQEVLTATAEVAKQQGYDIVLYSDEFVPQINNPDAVREQVRQRKVLYASPQVDLSATVVNVLNETYRAEPKKKMMSVDVGDL